MTAPAEALRRPIGRLLAIEIEAAQTRPSATTARPALALEFAERLIRCASLDAVRTLVRDDPAGSQSFLRLASTLYEMALAGKARPTAPPPVSLTEFAHLASAMMDFLGEARRLRPELWE